MGLGGLLLLLLPGLLTPRGPSTPAPLLLCSPVGPGSPASLILQGTSWMSRIGLPAKARPGGQQACWGGTDGLQTGNQTLPNSLTEGP